MDIRRGRGVWWSLARAQCCHVKRAKMYWQYLQWLKWNKGHSCGWLKQQNRFCIPKELSEASEPPNSGFVHISDVWLTSCSSTCVGRGGRVCCVCRPARPRSQTCIWWPVAGRCLGGLCWRWSQTDRPQTSATCPEGGKIKNAERLTSGLLLNMERHILNSSPQKKIKKELRSSSCDLCKFESCT